MLIFSSLEIPTVFPCGSDGKESACDVTDPASIPGLGRSPGEGNGNPLQYSCLENFMDRGAWWASVHGAERVGHDWVTKLVLTVLQRVWHICHLWEDPKSYSTSLSILWTQGTNYFKGQFSLSINCLCIKCWHIKVILPLGEPDICAERDALIVLIFFRSSISTA